MVKEFGKFTRKLRIDSGELLKDMAEKLGVTSSYLSAVEVGKKPVPVKWAAILKEKYDLSSQEYALLQNAIDKDNNQINIDLKDRSYEESELLLSFARRFDSLDDESRNKLKFILKFKEEKNE